MQVGCTQKAIGAVTQRNLQGALQRALATGDDLVIANIRQGEKLKLLQEKLKLFQELAAALDSCW